jgi:hypothetical protein
MSKEYLLKTKLSLDIINIICKYEFTLENLQRIYKFSNILEENFNYELIISTLIKALKYNYTGYTIDFRDMDNCSYYFNEFKDKFNEIITIKKYDRCIVISLNGMKENLIGFTLLNFL